MSLYNSILLEALATATAMQLATATGVDSRKGELYKSVWDLYNCNCVYKLDKHIFLNSHKSEFDSLRRSFFISKLFI